MTHNQSVPWNFNKFNKNLSFLRSKFYASTVLTKYFLIDRYTQISNFFMILYHLSASLALQLRSFWFAFLKWNQLRLFTKTTFWPWTHSETNIEVDLQTVTVNFNFGSKITMFTHSQTTLSAYRWDHYTAIYAVTDHYNGQNGVVDTP